MCVHNLKKAFAVVCNFVHSVAVLAIVKQKFVASGQSVLPDGKTLDYLNSKSSAISLVA